MIYRPAFIALWFTLLLATSANAAEPLFGGARPLVAPVGAEIGPGPSLFAGNQQGGFFAPLPERRTRDEVVQEAPTGRGWTTEAVYAEWIRGLIAQAEAGAAGYDAVVLSAKVKPPRRPTELTIAEIYDWIEDTPGQNHAIGRYQFIPVTLRRLVDHLGAPPNTRFSPEVQDALADQLLREAGLSALLAGKMPRKTFMNRLAAIWAGLPTSTGKSHYHGHAGNKATMSWRHFEAEMAKFFPE
ncbi:hypothetical protein FHY55_01105 [Oceanicola sp. D3]|uniref:hypothetical protein n=1 Tax=Oceanicola sp. D3 TaxID=2587163 RepID=UPI0011244B10|nr:hypothetical protein [Oceanicola sp. D3]QDC07925.1 hypothetical protein FHY55_01105 [Oceanicola sp. D3]